MDRLKPSTVQKQQSVLGSTRPFLRNGTRVRPVEVWEQSDKTKAYRVKIMVLCSWSPLNRKKHFLEKLLTFVYKVRLKTKFTGVGVQRNNPNDVFVRC